MCGGLRNDRGTPDKLHTAVGEECVGSDEESIKVLALKDGKGRIDFAGRAGVEDIDLQPDSAGSILHGLQCGLDSCRTGGIDEHGNTNSLGHQLMQECYPLCDHFLGEKIDASRVAAWPREAGDKTPRQRRGRF